MKTFLKSPKYDMIKLALFTLCLVNRINGFNHVFFAKISNTVGQSDLNLSYQHSYQVGYKFGYATSIAAFMFAILLMFWKYINNKNNAQLITA